MTVALFILRAFAVLDRLLRAPLDAGKALFTAVLPDRFLFSHFNITRRTDFFTNPAGAAFFIGKERFIHPGDMRQGNPVKRRQHPILPEGPLLRRPLIPAPDHRRDPVQFSEHRVKFLLLLAGGRGSAPGNIVAGSLKCSVVGETNL